MKTWQWMINLSAATLLLTSCASDSGTNQAAAPSTVQPVASPSAAPSPGSQTFSQPVIPAAPVTNKVSVPGLVQPTHAKARIPQITSGRQDPFAAIATSPIIVPSQNTSAAKPVPKLPPIPKATTTVPAAPAAPVAPAPAIALAPLPPLQSAPPDLSALPPAPAPVSPTSVAAAIEVTGVMQVGQKVSAIVQVPGEQTSRYVGTGDYLANGKVLVKRIQIESSGEPIVILEQNGVEVAKSVGKTNTTVARAF